MIAGSSWGGFANCRINHIQREVNGAADFLVKLGVSTPMKSPLELSYILYSEFIRTTVPRSIAAL